MGLSLGSDHRPNELLIKFDIVNVIVNNVMDTTVHFIEPESKIIEKVQKLLNKGFAINDIKVCYIIDKPTVDERNKLELIVKFYELYDVFDFMVSKGMKLYDIHHVKYLKKKNIDILIKYNYDMSEIIQYNLYIDRFELFKYTIDKYDISKCHDIFIHKKQCPLVYIALLIDKNYKLSKNEISIIMSYAGGPYFMQFIIEKSITEWFKTYVCHRCIRYDIYKDEICKLCYDKIESENSRNIIEETSKKIYNHLAEIGIAKNEN